MNKKVDEKLTLTNHNNEFLFTKNILRDKPINVYNFGKMRRCFTYIDDVIETITNLLDKKTLDKVLDPKSMTKPN